MLRAVVGLIDMPWLQSLKSKPEQCPNICKNKSFLKSSKYFWNKWKICFKENYYCNVMSKAWKVNMRIKRKTIFWSLTMNCNGLISYETEFSSQFIKKHARIKGSRYIKSRNKSEAATWGVMFFIKKETAIHVFSCKFCKIFKNTFCTEHFRLTNSGKANNVS